MADTNLSTTFSAITMSSVEIAELTGKRHADVMRDIRTMLEQIGEGERKFASAYNDAQGKVRECYNLPQDLTINLVAGYRADVRLKIVRRWMELEGGDFGEGGVMEKTPSRSKNAKPLKAKSPWVIQNERSDMFRDWVREVRKEVAADAPRRCWGLHRYSQWTVLVVDDDDGMNWQSRRCLRCGKIQDARR